MLDRFDFLDWFALAIYFAISILGGVLSTRRQEDTHEYFRASGTIPAWAAAISLLATSQSAATFIGAPQYSFKSDLAYFATNLSYVAGVVIVGYLFVPAIYRAGANTVYDYIQKRFHGATGFSCSLAFLIGRVFASGARIFIGALAIAYVVFGYAEQSAVIAMIEILAVAALIYTFFGGVRAVIWTDVLQAAIYITVLLVALWVAWYRISLSPQEVMEILSKSGTNGTSKLNLFETRSENYWSMNYSFFAIVIGHILIAMGAYGTDHDLVQRYLTCKDAKTGTRSAITGILVGVPIQFLFLVMGLLLFILYKQTSFVPNPETVVPLLDDKTLMVHFILFEMPAGLKGMMLAGLFAMTLASTASAYNAMSSSFVNDVVKWKWKDLEEKTLLKIGKGAMILFALLLGGFAVWSAYQMQGANAPKLVDFAMGVMTYAYSGLLGVFLVGVFTKRGNRYSVLISLLTGFVLIYLLTDFPIKKIAPDSILTHMQLMGFPWKMTLATGICFLICFFGRPEEKKEVAQNA